MTEPVIRFDTTTPTPTCLDCATALDLIPADGNLERQEYMAVERHVDKAHPGQPFSWRGWVRS